MTPLGELYYNHNVRPLEEKLQKVEAELRKGQQLAYESILRTVSWWLKKGEKLEEILEECGISREEYAKAIQYQAEKEEHQRKIARSNPEEGFLEEVGT